MARGINKVILVGNCGQDPETRYSAGGSAISNISIATSETWKDKQTGQAQERTEWHRVVFFNRLAEIVGEYVRKGSKIYVEGRLQTRKWQDQNGQDRYTTEIVASEMQMLDSRGGDNYSPQQGQGGYSAPMAPQQNSGMAPQQNSAPPYGGNPAPQQNYGGAPTAPPSGGHVPPADHAPAPAAPGMDSFDDDIPF